MTNAVPSDGDWEEALARVFDYADGLMTGTSEGTLWRRPQPGSRMEDDNRATDPHHLSHVIQTLLNAAIEHLHATAGLVRKARLIHGGPPFTLCRAAVEAAATAYWLLAAERQQTRMWRLAVYIGQDTRDYEEVSKLVTERLKQQFDPTQFADRRAWRDALKKKFHLTGLPPQLNTQRMLSDVDEAIAAHDQRDDDHHMKVYWKAASGFAHGRQWASLNVLRREEVTPLGDATATVKLTSEPSRVLWGAAAAYELIDRAVALYYLACGYDLVNGEPKAPDDAT